MITPEEIELEKKYLKKVINILNEQIEQYSSRVKSLSNNIQEQMNYAWDKTNRLSDTEFVYAVANIQKRSVYAENANKKLTNYKKMLNNAYFARIDFDDGTETIPVYIGIASLQSGDDFYVYDWRAPISSMFYNCEVGDASYTISTGEKITGKITLKRQYKISGDEIKEVFDTDIQIIDNILKNILSANASNKMKNIVNTIQKEQNEIIRKNDVDILIVQGPAGSGKTSIAMHKIAYLLYAERDKINNTNVMILSPNEIFNNYISDVLPEIGEDNVVQATFYEFAKSYITEFHISTKIEDVYEIVYGKKDEFSLNKFNEVKFKSDDFYTEILETFIKQNEIELMGLEPIEIQEQTVLSLDEIKQIANKIPDEGESLYLRGKKIIERIFVVASMKSKKQLTLEKLKKETLENLVKIKIKIAALFKKLYSNKEEFINLVKDVAKKLNREDILNFNLDFIFDESAKNLSDDNIEFQDVTPFMFFKSKIIGITANKKIKYVLIDEAQDYSITQYKILSMLFRNSNLTLLGDLNQSIMPFNEHNNYNEIISTIKSFKPNAISNECNLTKTYRSTYEINEFAKKLILNSNSNYSQIDRHGEPVKLNRQEKFNAEEIVNRAITLKKSFNTVAIVCKNIEETLLYNQIVKSEKYLSKFRIVTKNDNVFVEDKIMIIPSYLSKGLEFDAVIVSNASSEKYDESERKLLYVVLTRALHKLEIYFDKTLTPLLLGEINE